jgi:uncharacterized repeat protein (TIGR04042 family)
MPEMTFTVRWPDGSVDDCYSPSLVMHDHLAVGATYPVGDFVARTSEALESASARVRARFGFSCTSAMHQQDMIITRAVDFDPAAPVEVLAMVPALPFEIPAP